MDTPLPLKTNVSCSNPYCSNLITIPIDQKRELLTDNFLKYGKISLIYCSKACQEAHQVKLSESKFFEKGNLKNHSSALIRKGVSFKKRWKKTLETASQAGGPEEISNFLD